MWDAFLNAIFWVIEKLHAFSGDWGLAIILITIVFRMIIYPITARQFKSTYKMQKMQPKIKEIQEKYNDDKARQQEEMMKVYKEAKFNPLSGCLPMILQMPIFIALFQVLRSLPDRIAGIGGTEAVLPATFYSIIPDLSKSSSNVFSLTPDGILAFIPYILLVVLFGVSMLIPLLINKTRDRNTLMMTGIMAVMMLFFGWSSPAGVLLYWDTSSLLGVAQQAIYKKVMERKDAEKEEEMIEIKPVKVEVERAIKKPRPKKGGK